MSRRLLLVTILLTALNSQPPVHPSFAQAPDDQAPSAPPSESPPPSIDESHPSEFTTRELEDAATMLADLRGNLRMSPDNAEARLKLAQGLYQIGDLDAAIDECRVAIKLNPQDAKAHLQLGVILMAK